MFFLKNFWWRKFKTCGAHLKLKEHQRTMSGTQLQWQERPSEGLKDLSVSPVSQDLELIKNIELNIAVLRGTCLKSQHKEYVVMKKHRDIRYFALCLCNCHTRTKSVILQKSVSFYDSETFFCDSEEMNLITCRLMRLQPMLLAINISQMSSAIKRERALF